MSYVSLLLVQKDGLVTSYAEARNNHGFAPLVWDVFARKYTGYNDKYSVMAGGMFGGDDQLKKV